MYQSAPECPGRFFIGWRTCKFTSSSHSPPTYSVTANLSVQYNDFSGNSPLHQYKQKRGRGAGTLFKTGRKRISGGCLFLDSRVACDFSGGNSIIYGHYRKNGSMFAALAGYKEQSYYDQYPQMLLITPESAYTVELFSGYVTGTDGQAWQTVFSDEEAFVQWLGSVADASMFQSDVEPMASDRILTLSTCSYEFENARFVLLGVLRPLSN